MASPRYKEKARQQSGLSSRCYGKLTVNNISRPTSETIAGQLLQEARRKPEAVQAVAKLRVSERQRRRGYYTVRRPLISTEDWSLEFFLLPAQWCTHNRAPHLMLKDPLGLSQAWCFECPICDSQGDEVGDRTEDRVVYFSKEEDRATVFY